MSEILITLSKKEIALLSLVLRFTTDEDLRQWYELGASVWGCTSDDLDKLTNRISELEDNN